MSVRHFAHAESPRGARTAPARRRQTMHPFLKSWRCARQAFPICGGHGVWRGPAPAEEGPEEGFGGGGFGVRRPLRFLAHRLDLDDRQVTELARILDALRTERAQAEVDRRRTLTAFADSVSSETFDAAKAAEGGDLRLQSAERLRQA